MMAYDNGYVVSIIHDGSPVREIGRKVRLPFNSEYKIRLKNKTNLRAKARVFIDGRKVSNLGDFILNPNQTMDLERFLDHSLNKGNKFKFVPLSDSRVNDPTDSENGIVKVEFYKEIDYSWNIIDDRRNFNKVKNISPSYCGYSGKGTAADGSFNFTTTNGKISSHSLNAVNLFNSPLPASAGATVEGGNSNQGFAIGDFFLTEEIPTVVSLKIEGLEKYNLPVKSKKMKTRFCSYCGRRRSKMVDKFCPRCGNGY